MRNEVSLIGRVGQEPESRTTQTGKTVVTLSLATSERWTDKATGERKEATEWHRVVLFDRLADIAAEYVKKGSLLHISGSIKSRKYEDKNGNSRIDFFIQAKDLLRLGEKSQDSGASRNAQNKSNEKITAPDPDDDIPF